MTFQRTARVLACAAGLLLVVPASAEAWIMPKQLLAAYPPKAAKPPRAAKPRKAVSRRATLTKTGRAIAPPGAPKAVRRIIQAGNRIAHKPYVYGGGHGTWQSAGYDCSGSVSYALHGAGKLDTQLASGALMSYGKAGKGKWVTIYAHGGHTYMVVAGLRFDTTAFKQGGSRWTRDLRSGGGYTVRHPAGL